MNDLLRSLAEERERRRDRTATAAVPRAPRASAHSAEIITNGEGVYRDLLSLIVEPMRLELRNTFASVCRMWRVAARCVYCEAKFSSTIPSSVAVLTSDEVAVAHAHGSLHLYGFDGTYRRSLRNAPSAVSGMAFDSQSRHLFLANRLGSVYRYRMPSGVLEWLVRDFNVLQCPEDICLSQNVVFVADSTAHRIATFDAETGEFLRFLGNQGELFQPQAVAVQHDRAFVVDSIKDHIVNFSWPTGDKLTTIGKKGRAPGEFMNLRGLAIVRNYLLVIEERRIQLLTRSGVPCQVLVLGLLQNAQLRGACFSSERNTAMVADVGQGCVHRLAFALW